MGSVWRAQHLTLGRHFAIKFLKTTLMGGEPLERRFLLEARLAASIQHRFVVDIVDYGVTAEAIPYMVMEFLEGESLDRRGRRMPPLSVPALLRICAEVSLGLEAVHQAGVVHRDLKPENIMLVREADGIIPKLVDFGISGTESAAPYTPGRRRLTHPGAFMGTPWYMSPEQARRAEADRRSDIYSMGVIIYEAVSGDAPYDHPELPALIEAVKAGGAPPLSQKRPEVGAELSALVERAMALDPAARFESAAELSARLLEIAAHLPETLLCAPPPVVSRTDTEVVGRPSPGARNRTQELEGDRQERVVSGSMAPSLVGRWRESRRERAAAVAGALLGAGLLLWAATRPQRPPTPDAPVPLQAAVQVETTGQGLRALRPAPTETAVTQERPTLTNVGPVAGGPPPEERRPARRRHAEGRGRSPAVVPDVFRSPGF